MLCINQKCESCKDFPKLTHNNAELFSSLKCSDSCFKNSLDCTDHKVKRLQYERAPYNHKGVTKKKIQLADKFVTLPELMNQGYANLRENSIVKIQDFSGNYKCLLPPEIQSLLCTQNQCTIYPVVVLHKLNDKIKEDHFVVISDDIKDDVKFVELANIKIDEYYTQKGIVFENEIKLNDGCSSQYKSNFAL